MTLKRRQVPVLDPRTPQLKKQAVSFLEDGQQEFTLDVPNLARRERNKVRMRINRWLRIHNLRGRVHWDGDAETLNVQVLGQREEEGDERDRHQCMP